MLASSLSATIFPTQFQHYVYLSKYARFLPDKNRRETWDETVARYFDFFTSHLKENCDYTLTKELRLELEQAVLNFDVMPSMRCLMTAGEALKRENIAGYNCSYNAIDNQKAFSEILYILMQGTGCGFSVERQYVNKLPEIPDELHPTDTTIVVRDSKLGWASSLNELISLLYTGLIPKWDVSKVRPAGSLLKTFGGRASGPEPLVRLFKFIIQKFEDNKGQKLSSLDCHEIVCMIGECIVVGGVRRSALISLSNLSDDRMRSAKTGQWWLIKPYLSISNNSAVYTDKKPSIGSFMDEWKSLYDSKSGERGIFSRYACKNVIERSNEFRKHNFSHLNSVRFRDIEDIEFGCNPCSEIILRPDQFCNLTEIIVSSLDTLTTLLRKVRIASILGTFQSTLTKFKFLSKKWQNNTEDERLLGVSLTGINDNQLLSGQYGEDLLKESLTSMRQTAILTNIEFAEALHIPVSTAVTCTKPSGCMSLDSKIKTNEGIKTFAQIFAQLAPNIDLFELDSGDWIIPSNKLKVYDENNDEQEITKLYVNGFEEIYEIVDDLGNIYKFTGKHELKTKNGLKKVKDITIDDEIIQF